MRSVPSLDNKVFIAERKGHEAFAWCVDNLGDRSIWHMDYSDHDHLVVYFHKSEDAVLFALKFK